MEESGGQFDDDSYVLFDGGKNRSDGVVDDDESMVMKVNGVDNGCSCVCEECINGYGFGC